MKNGQVSTEPIITILDRAERGDQSVSASGRPHSVAEPTFARWRQHGGGLSVAQAQRLRDREPAHARRTRLRAARDREVDAQRSAGTTRMPRAQRRDAVRVLVPRGLGPTRAGVVVPLPRATVQEQPRSDRTAALPAQVAAVAAPHPRAA